MGMQLGYTMMTEQAGPKDLVSHVVGAEEVGFDFAVSSDHFFPWLDEMGHSPNAWVTLGAAAHATSRIDLMTYVTCPIIRYRPAVVAQQAATLQLLSDGRFTLGLGAGENLNEHVHGEYYDVDGGKIWDLPEGGVPIGLAVSGEKSVELAAEYADVLIATEPKPELVDQFEAAGGATKKKVGQMPISYGTDKAAAVTRAHELFRWFGLGWKVNADLPGTAGFDAASQFVREEDVEGSIPCGDDVEAVIEAAKEYAEAGFTDLALVQIGGDQQEPYLEWAQRELMP